ncbi:6897_t:CDS:2, partial [Gigaspora rosea]
VESNHATLADCYINLIKIAAAIQNLFSNEYKGFRNYCITKFDNQFEEFNDPIYHLTYFLHPAYKGIGLKFGTFPLITNYAGKLWQQMEQKQYINGNPNPYAAPYRIEQLHLIYTIEVSPEIIANIAESVFKKLEEEETLLDDEVESSNSIFTCTHSRTSFKDLDRNESDNDMQDSESEYNVDEIVARQLDYDLDNYDSQ